MKNFRLEKKIQDNLDEIESIDPDNTDLVQFLKLKHHYYYNGATLEQNELFYNSTCITLMNLRRNYSESI